MDKTLIVNSVDDVAFNSAMKDFDTGDFSKELAMEAYELCKSENNINLGFDEWRGTISLYAVHKNNNGEYVYDETIAEAFHDVYLNKDNAKMASKYVIKVLKSKL